MCIVKKDLQMLIQVMYSYVLYIIVVSYLE